MASVDETVRLGEIEYRVGRLGAWDQLHVARKVGPLYANVLQSGSAAVRGDISVAALLGPVMSGLASLSKEDSEYLIRTCLSACQRRQLVEDKEVWSKVAINGKIMFDDVGVEEMYRLTLEVVKANLGNFFQGLLRQFSGSPETAKAPS